MESMFAMVCLPSKSKSVCQRIAPINLINLRPSDFAKSEEGAQTARKIWNELLARFDLTEGEVLGRA